VLYTTIESPLGDLLLHGDGVRLHGLAIQAGRQPGTVEPGWQRDPTAFTDVERQLLEYFSGERTSFELELEPRGTPFQRQVWQALRQIVYGETMPYGELAARIGRPSAARAVGAANGALTGYAGGVERKQALLDLEARSYAAAGLWRRQVKLAIEPRTSVGTIVSAR